MYKKPVNLFVDSHIIGFYFLTTLIISSLVQKIGASTILILTFYKMAKTFFPFSIFMGVFHFLQFFLNLFFAIKFKLKNNDFLNKAFLNIISSTGLFFIYLGIALYGKKWINSVNFVLFALPNIICSSGILGYGFWKGSVFFIFGVYDLFESIQILFIFLKIQYPNFYLNWDFVFLFYTIFSKILSWLTVVFWLIFLIYLIGLFLHNCVKKISDTDSFFLLLGVAIFYLIWSSYCFEYFVNGAYYFLESNQKLENPVFLNINYTLFSTSWITICFSTISLLVYWICYKRIEKVIPKYFRTNSVISEINVTKVLGDLTGNLKRKMSVLYNSKKKQKLKNEETKKMEIEMGELIDLKRDTVTCVEMGAVGDKNKLCGVCFDNQDEVMMDPCGHVGFCSQCLLDIMRDKNCCPVCANFVNQVFLTYWDFETKQLLTKGVITFRREPDKN